MMRPQNRKKTIYAFGLVFVLLALALLGLQLAPGSGVRVATATQWAPVEAVTASLALSETPGWWVEVESTFAPTPTFTSTPTSSPVPTTPTP